MSAIINPVEQYFDLDGSPLQDGYLYFGVPFGNPITQPTMVYFDAEFTIPAPQPIRTINGYPVRAGTATGLYAPDSVSAIVQNKNKQQVSYSQTSQINNTQTTTEYRTSDSKLLLEDNNKTFILLNAFTQTFDACAVLGDKWSVNIVNFSSGNVILEPNLSETINGLTNLTLPSGGSIVVYSDGIGLKTDLLILSTNSTSATSITIDTITPKVFAVGLDKGYKAGMSVICSPSLSSPNFIYGQVVSYAGGNLTISNDYREGTGTFASWNISEFYGKFNNRITQIVTAANSTRTLVSCTANVWRDTGLTVTITPLQSNSKLDIDWRVGFSGQDANIPVRVRLVRGASTVISNGSGANAGLVPNGESLISTENLTWVDDANGTTAIIYKIQIMSTTTQTVAVNGGFSGSVGTSTTSYAKIKEISQ